MKFDEWWTERRNKLSIEYSKLGKYAIRNIAQVSYEQGYIDAMIRFNIDKIKKDK